MSNVVILRFVGDDKSLDAAFKRVQAQSVKTNSFLNNMGKFSKGMTQVGKGLSQYITLPVLAAGFGAVKLATDFQTSMTHIRTLVGASQKQVAAWSEQILQLAPKVGKSPRELADALYFITSSGIAASRAMGVLTFAAKASAAGLGATQVVADTVTSAMNAYGQKVLTAKNATDVLLATVRDGKAEPEELARSLGRVVSPAALLGVTFRQVGAAVAAMTDTGLDAFTSTTALRQIFVTLLKPAAQTEKQMGKLGLSAAGLRTELREKGLLATMETLHQKGEKNVATFGKLFPNVRALNGFLSMMGPNAKQTSRIFADLAKDGNDTNRAFEIASQTAGVKFHQALAALMVVGIRIGNDVLPAVTKFAGEIATLAQKFDELSPHTRHMIEEWALVAAAVGPTVFLLGKIGMGLTAIAKHPIITVLALLATEFIHLYTTSQSFRNSVNGVAAVLSSAAKAVYDHRTAIVALTAGFAAFFAVIKGYELVMAIAGAITAFSEAGAIATTVIKGVRGAMLLLNLVLDANPVFLIATAIGVLVVAFVELWNHSASFRNFWKALWVDIKSAFGDFAGFFIQSVKFIGDAFFAYAGFFLHTADKAFGWIPGIGDKLHGATKAFDAFHNEMDSKLTTWANDMYGLGESSGANLSKGMANGINAGETRVYASVATMAAGTIKVAKTKLQIESPSKVFDQIGQWVGKGLAQGISKSTIGVLSVVNDQTKKLQSTYEDRLAAVREALQHITDVTQGHFAGKGKHRHFVGPTPGALHGAQNRLQNAKDAAADAKKALEAAQNAILNLDLRREAGAPLLGLAGRLTQGIADALGHAKGPIENIAASLSDTIKTQFSDASGAVPAAVQSAMDNLQKLAEDAANFRSSFIDQLKSSSDITSLVGQTDSEGNPVAVTGGSIKAFLGGQIAKLKQFAADLGILGRKGVPSDFLQQIAQAGLDNGLPIAEALINSSDADFQNILDLQAQLNQLTTATGDMAQSSIFAGALRGQSVTGRVPLGTTDAKSVVINVSAQTDADPNQIANEIAWALKTSGS